MKTIRMICRKCGAVLKLESGEHFSRISCPYCGGDSRLMVESDRVRIARIQADSERSERETRFAVRREEMRMERTRRRIQIGIICVFAVVTAVLLWLTLRQFGILA